MISIEKSFKTSDGKLFGTVDEAKQHELVALLNKAFPGGSLTPEQIVKLAGMIIEQEDHVVNLLTMKATSHPKARKSNGATRKPRQTAPAVSLATAAK